MASGKFIIGGVFVCAILIGVIPLFFRDYKYFNTSENNTNKLKIFEQYANNAGNKFQKNNLVRTPDVNNVLGTYNDISIRRSDLSVEEQQTLFDTEDKTYKVVENILAKRYFDAFVQEYMKKNNISNPQIALKLLLQEESTTSNKILETAMTDGSIQVTSLAKPIMPRVSINVDNAPSKGTEHASVTIVEFSDFQCPECSESQVMVDELLKEYEGKINYVFENYPLPSHPEAMSAAIVANCAQAQNKYWEMHAALFQNYNNLSEDLFNKLIRNLHLDAKKYAVCKDSQTVRKIVTAGINYGQSLGITVTPVFYINGIQLVGKQPKSEFEKIINEELAAQY